MWKKKRLLVDGRRDAKCAISDYLGGWIRYPGAVFVVLGRVLDVLTFGYRRRSRDMRMESEDADGVGRIANLRASLRVLGRMVCCLESRLPAGTRFDRRLPCYATGATDVLVVTGKSMREYENCFHAAGYMQAQVSFLGTNSGIFHLTWCNYVRNIIFE